MYVSRCVFNKDTRLLCLLLLCISTFQGISGQECKADQWRCGSEDCISRVGRCDGEKDCSDGSDESNCEDWVCPAYKWRCRNHRCVLFTLRCDGNNNCGDNSDEDSCEQWNCLAFEWRCRNNRCVSLTARCDGRDDCGDGSDEDKCESLLAVCPHYVMEGVDVNCNCRFGQPTKSLKGTWLERNGEEILSLTNVQRRDNGTTYTCVAPDFAGVLREHYVLRVAYGPYEGHVTVGPRHVITNGSQTVTLTCNVTEVYPRPYVTWGGVVCENQFPDDRCDVTPDPAGDVIKNVTCTATSVTLKRYASATVHLSISYPPKAPPVIRAGSHGSRSVREGARVTCAVEGGNPLVDSVSFYCLTPDLRDESDEVGMTSVRSSVTVTAVHQDSNMTCICNATWNAHPDYYLLTSTAVFNVQRSSSFGSWTTVAVTVGGLLPLLCLTAVCWLLWKRRSRLQSLYRNMKIRRQRSDRVSGLYADIDEFPVHHSTSSQCHVTLPAVIPTCNPLPFADETTDEMDAYSRVGCDGQSEPSNNATLNHTTEAESEEEEDQDDVYNHLQHGRRQTSNPHPVHSNTYTLP